MPQLGISKGLSWTNDWDKDIDRVYQREEYAANVRAEKERKTQYYAGLLKQGHATNPRTEGELNEFYKGLNNELADFVVANPNFETDVNAMQKFLDISDRYLNNDILRRDLQVSQEFERLRNNTDKLTPSQLRKEMDRYNEYITSEPGSDVAPYVFSNPKIKTTGELVKEMSDLIETEEGPTKLDPISHTYYTRTAVNPLKARQVVEAHYADEDNRAIMDQTYQNYMETHKDEKTLFPDVLTFYAKQAENSKRNDRNTIGRDEEWVQKMEYEWSKAGQSGNAGMPYTNFIMNELPNIQRTNIDPLSNTPMKATENVGTAPASTPAVAFTTFKRYKTQTTLNGKDSGAIVNTKSNGKKPFLYDISAQATNVVDYVNINGTLYIETEIMFNNGENLGMGVATEGPVIPEDVLTDMEFIRDEKVIDPGYSSGGTNKSWGKGASWKGRILMPANINASTIIDFESNAPGGGIEHIKEVSPWLTQDIETRRLTDPALLRHMVKTRTGVDIGTGIQSVEYDQDLSNSAQSTIVVLKNGDGSERALDVNTGKIHQFHYEK
jgi:hypothetical protein